MKLRSNYFKVGALLIVGALGVSACGSSNDSSSSSTAASADKTVVIDQVFTLKSADPAHSYEMTGNILARAMYSTLVSYKGDDLTKLVPDLATSWTASPDGKTVTFKLDPKAVFSDGTKVTSADVVFSLTRVANVKGNPSFLMDGLTATAPDPETVVVTAAAFDPAILPKLASPSLAILNSAQVKAAGGTDAADAATTDKAETALNSASMGSGPYTLKSLGMSTEVDLVVNPKYWGTKPYYDKVVLRNVAAAQQKNNVASGQSQLALDLSPDQVKNVTGDAVSASVPSQFTFYMFTNANPSVNKWTANTDFQNAVRTGLDYQGLLDLAGSGAQQAPGMVPVQLDGALPPADAVKTDVEGAKALVTKSGYDGSAIELSYPTDLTQNGVSFTDLATRVQADMKKIGINLELKGGPVSTLLEMARAGKQQMGLWLWGPDFPDASNYVAFAPGGIVAGNRVNWKKGAAPEIEALAAKALAEPDATKRAADFQEFQRGLNTASPIISLIQPAQVFLSAKALKGLAYNLVWTVNVAELSQ